MRPASNQSTACALMLLLPSAYPDTIQSGDAVARTICNSCGCFSIPQTLVLCPDACITSILFQNLLILMQLGTAQIYAQSNLHGLGVVQY